MTTFNINNNHSTCNLPSSIHIHLQIAVRLLNDLAAAKELSVTGTQAGF